MITISLIYFFSLVLSFLYLRKGERKMGVREGMLWAPALFPGWNTVLAIWYILDLIDELINLIKGQK